MGGMRAKKNNTFDQHVLGLIGKYQTAWKALFEVTPSPLTEEERNEWISKLKKDKYLKRTKMVFIFNQIYLTIHCSQILYGAKFIHNSKHIVQPNHCRKST
jgi:hypothetical protein